MEPILRGQVKLPDDGRTIWEGRWGMNASAFEDQSSEQLNTFRYTCANRVNFVVGDTISFKGYFEVTSVNKGSKSQFTDKSLEMEVESEDSESGMRIIKGKGSNRFGNFDIIGTFNPSTNVLEVRRVYSPRPLTVQRVVTRKVSEEEAAGSQTSNEKFKTTSQPQSPSSPAEVQTTPSKASQIAIPTDSRANNLNAALEQPQPQIPVDSSFYSDAKSVLRELKARDTNKWFSIPVDAEALGLRDYHNVVKTPMDLGTVQTKLDSKSYLSWEDCLADMRLVFVNALMYNPRSSLVYKAASELNLFLEERVKRVGKGKLGDQEKSASIGKRLHKKKKFFEPGDLQGVTSNVVSIKKTPKSTKMSLANMTASATTQPTKKSKKITISLSKRVKIAAEHNDAIITPLDPLGDEVALPRIEMDDGEGVDSFDELDREDEVFMTPPPSYDDGALDVTPFSTLPLIPDYNAYGAMSPTNLEDADDF